MIFSNPSDSMIIFMVSFISLGHPDIFALCSMTVVP